MNDTVAKRSYRNPVGRARGLGSGKSGAGHFWWQRVTAVVLAILSPWLVGTLISLVGADLATVRAAFSGPWSAVFAAMFVIALFWHLKMGLQVVVEDYVHTRATEVVLQFLITFACAIGALASLYAIARIAVLA